MNKWTNPSFEFESRSIVDPNHPEFAGLIRVTLSLYAAGSYEEPMLMQDGAPLFELIVGGDVIREIEFSEFSLEEQVVLEGLIEGKIEELEQDHGDEIGQDVAERMADALYESWRDR